MKLVIVTAVSLLMLGGCALVDPPKCTKIGADSGVTFLVDDLGQLPGPVRITSCADDQCVTKEGASVHFVFARLDSVTSVHSVPVRLTVETASGVVFDATTTVTLHKVQPNGPRCSPTVYQAGLRAAADGTLKPA